MAPADFEAAVIFLDDFVKVMWRLTGSGLEGIDKSSIDSARVG